MAAEAPSFNGKHVDVARGRYPVNDVEGVVVAQCARTAYAHGDVVAGCPCGLCDHDAGCLPLQGLVNAQDDQFFYIF
jgi:hypothetical protein